VSFWGKDKVMRKRRVTVERADGQKYIAMMELELLIFNDKLLTLERRASM
jgi:hypothetical protein